jgi:hypothetical protein
VILRPSPFHADLLGEGVKLFIGTVGDHVAPEVIVTFSDAPRKRGMFAVVVVTCKEQWIDVNRHAGYPSVRHLEREAYGLGE